MRMRNVLHLQLPVRRSTRNSQKPVQPDTCLPRCRRLSPSCSSPRAPAEKSACEDDAAGRRWRATAWIYLGNRLPATRSRKRRENSHILYHAQRGSGPAQNPLAQECQPNSSHVTHAGFDPCDLGFQDMARADRHRVLQMAVHVYDVLQSNRLSYRLRKNLNYNCINRTEETWTFLRPYITDIHREKSSRVHCRVSSSKNYWTRPCRRRIITK